LKHCSNRFSSAFPIDANSGFPVTIVCLPFALTPLPYGFLLLFLLQIFPDRAFGFGPIYHRSTTVKIREIRAAGLRGAAPQGGWSSEMVQEDCVHTLVAVLTDDGVTGIGSVFTSSALGHPSGWL
jgi:hypothetical protein